MRKILYLGILALMTFQLNADQERPKVVVISREEMLQSHLQDIKEIAKAAGEKVLEIRKSGQLISQDVVLHNGKKMRQTNADLEAGQLIIEELSKKYPTFGILSQDQVDKDPHWHAKKYLWVINPIDGTKEYEKGSDEFHVQIGLLVDNKSILGVSYFPAKDTYVWAIKGQGAWLEQGSIKRRLMMKSSKENILIKSSGYNRIEPYFDEWNWKPEKMIEEGLSTTGRLLEVVQGDASLYISLGATAFGGGKMGGTWNYGANTVIAEEAGLILKTLKGNEINLRQPDGLLTEGVVLTNDPELYEKVIQSDWDLNSGK